MSNSAEGPQEKKPLRPRGRALRRTPAQLDRLSKITRADIAKGKRWWRTASTLRYRNLPDATPQP